MLTLLQPQAVAQNTPLSAVEMTSKVLEKQVQARYASLVPTGTFSTPTGDVSLESLVESALAADPAYGLLASLSPQDATEAYTSSLKLLTEAYGNATATPQTVENV